MGLLIIVTPYLIYFFIVKWLFNKYYKGENKKKRFIFFLLVVTLPLWDHIAGYIVYKYLCITKGGVKIYKTISDEKEQRDYWISRRVDPVAENYQHDDLDHYGLNYNQYFSSDFTKVYNLYYEHCSDVVEKKYVQECKDSINNKFKRNKKSELSILIPYKKVKYDPNDPKFRKPKYLKQYKQYGDYYVDDSSLEMINVVNNQVKRERAYFNYCKDEYNNFSKEDKNYKKSCTYANSLIKKYNLENVVKILPSKYRLSILKYNRKKIIPFLEVYESYSFSENIETNELLSEHYGYTFRGGWYEKTTNPYYPFSSHCRGAIKPRKYEKLFNKKGMYETLIPNPFKETKK